MATQHSRSAARIMMAPAVILLLGWMLVPLTMTLLFSFKKYLPLRGGDLGWVGFDNYIRFVSATASGSQANEAACMPISRLITGGSPSMFITMGVIMPSGCTELQRTALPCCLRYTAVLIVKLRTAAFEAV